MMILRTVISDDGAGYGVVGDGGGGGDDDDNGDSDDDDEDDDEDDDDDDDAGYGGHCELLVGVHPELPSDGWWWLY